MATRLADPADEPPAALSPGVNAHQEWSQQAFSPVVHIELRSDQSQSLSTGGEERTLLIRVTRSPKHRLFARNGL